MAIIWTSKPYKANTVEDLSDLIQADLDAALLGDPMLTIRTDKTTRNFDEEVIVIWRDMGAP